MDEIMKEMCGGNSGVVLSKKSFLQAFPTCLGRTLSKIDQVLVLIGVSGEFLMRLSIHDYTQPTCMLFYAHQEFRLTEYFDLHIMSEFIRKDLVGQQIDKQIIDTIDKGFGKKVVSTYIEFEKKRPNAGQMWKNVPINLSIYFEFHDGKTHFSNTKHYPFLIHGYPEHFVTFPIEDKIKKS